VARLRVRLQPNASREEVAGWQGEELRVRVTAPPVEGKANRALIELLAKELRVAKNSIAIIGGQTARVKVVNIEGLNNDELRQRLP